jgi:ArsR family transcriptional regulator
MKGCEDMKKELESCSEGCEVHDDIINNVRYILPEEEILYDLAELFKVFGDTTRIKILYVLLESEMCVCDIAELLNMTQSAISHQLRVLKQSSLVKFRREGKAIFYSLADNHVVTILNQGMDHIGE